MQYIGFVCEAVVISGRLIRQEITRHMVTKIYNVTRDMDQISCYADNGYGTPMQASKKIKISRKCRLRVVRSGWLF